MPSGMPGLYTAQAAARAHVPATAALPCAAATPPQPQPTPTHPTHAQTHTERHAPHLHACSTVLNVSWWNCISRPSTSTLCSLCSDTNSSSVYTCVCVGGGGGAGGNAGGAG